MLSPKIVLVAEITAAVLTMGAAFAIPAAALPGDSCQEGSSTTCTQPALLCPQGYEPSATQPSVVGTLCVVAGHDKAGDLHAIARLSPLLCAHLVVGNRGRPEDLVRTLRCPVYVPPASETPTEAPPAPVAPTPPVNNVPVAPAPTIVTSNLPVTH